MKGKAQFGRAAGTAGIRRGILLLVCAAFLAAAREPLQGSTVTFDFIGSNATLWFSSDSSPFAFTTTAPGDIASDYDNFLFYTDLPAAFGSFSFAPDDTITSRGQFRLLPDATLGQLTLHFSPLPFGFGFSVGNYGTLAQVSYGRLGRLIKSGGCLQRHYKIVRG